MNLISKQPETYQGLLAKMIVFWERIKFRLAAAFKNNLHNVARSSLAEAAQGCKKAGRGLS